MRISPLSEVSKQHTGWESLSADSDTLEDTITSQLMQHKLSVHLSWCFVLVGDDATHEMRGGGEQGLHQVIQLFLVTE